jgi:hypothetical protein
MNGGVYGLCSRWNGRCESLHAVRDATRFTRSNNAACTKCNKPWRTAALFFSRSVRVGLGLGMLRGWVVGTRGCDVVMRMMKKAKVDRGGSVDQGGGGISVRWTPLHNLG